jgi:hypothetical protein
MKAAARGGMSLQMSLGRFSSLIGAKAETLTELELRVMRLIVSSSRGSCGIATPAEKEAFVGLVEHGFIHGPRLTPAGWAALRAVDDDRESD